MGLESESGEVTIPVEESTGEIKIANDVVATIAALAATETKGVAYLSGSLTLMSLQSIQARIFPRVLWSQSKEKMCLYRFHLLRVWMQRTGFVTCKGTGAR